MSSFRRPRLFLAFVFAAIALGLTLSASGQPVPAVTPNGKKTKGPKDKDDRDWNETIHLPVEREAKNKIDAVNKYLNGTEQITP
jgi:hypothetical protein